MKKIENLKKFTIGKQEQKKILGGNEQSLFAVNCGLMMTLANNILDSGFYRCPAGCEEADIIYAANICAGRIPWEQKKFGKKEFSSL
ncbi:hypothetical protein [Tenacibaculum jejuense]|uniref:hypothetical protein n=1 Tax=Tenacibaculum jejuense TaxID=584609 RepID=UPI000BA30618|nr:hypothetical protein [Tenacibaculum jejuense]